MKRPVAALLFTAAITAVAPPLAADEQDRALFTLNGKVYGESTLSDRLALALYKLEFEHHYKRRQLVEDAAFQAHAAARAAADGKGLEETVSSLLAVEPASDETLRAVYAANQQRINAPFEQVRGRIEQFVAMQQRQAKKREIVAGLTADGSFAPAEQEPVAPRLDIATEGFPAQGADDAAVTVVEFADYQCPFCKVAAEVLDEMMAAHPDRLRRVFLDFPINPSGISRKVAMGAECARRQGRYWDYHELAFEQQRLLDDNAAASLAHTLQLEPEAFLSCMEDPATAAHVARAEAEALRLGLDSTPSLFLNGRPLILQDIGRDLPKAIESALEQTGAR